MQCTRHRLHLLPSLRTKESLDFFFVTDLGFSFVFFWEVELLDLDVSGLPFET